MSTGREINLKYFLDTLSTLINGKFNNGTVLDETDDFYILKVPKHCEVIDQLDTSQDTKILTNSTSKSVQSNLGQESNINASDDEIEEITHVSGLRKPPPVVLTKNTISPARIQQTSNYKWLFYDVAGLQICALTHLTMVTGTSASVFTDGSAKPSSGGIMGWAYVFDQIDGKECTPIFANGGYKASTNNRGELMAILMALYVSKGVKKLLIRSDSKYCIESISLRLKGWIRTGRLTSSGGNLKNRDLLIAISKLIDGRVVEFEHVTGHSGNYFNEMADKLAKREYGEPLPDDVGYE